MFSRLINALRYLFTGSLTPAQEGEILAPESDPQAQPETDADAHQYLILKDTHESPDGEKTAIEVRGDGIHLQPASGGEQRVVPLHDARLLADIDEDIRQQIARKISLLVPALAESKKELLLRHVFRALFLLAQDQLSRVRQMIAEELRDSYDAPHELIRALAWDEDMAVASPVLEFSPLLSDHDLTEIISQSDIPGVLEAISRRSTISGNVTDAIVRNVTQSRMRNEDVRVINTLLENKGAIFTEDTLETLVDSAPDHEIWHASLVERPEMTTRMHNKIARFVSEALILEMKERGLISEAMGTNLTHAISSRLQSPHIDREREADRLAVEMFTQGTLDGEAIIAGQEAGEHEFVIAALSLMADIPKPATKAIFAAKDPKAIVALAWKAGLQMRDTIPLQLKVAKVHYTKILYAKEGKYYPLSESAMNTSLNQHIKKMA